MMRPGNSCCGNEAGLVQKFIGSAYDTVKSVADNLEEIKFIFDFMAKYDVLLCVESLEQLKAVNEKSSKFVRWYVDGNGANTYTDYIYVSDDKSGVLPDNPLATGSWVKVNTFLGAGASNAIPWLYNKGSANGGEVSIHVEEDAIGVSEIFINGLRKHLGIGYTYEPVSRTIQLSAPLAKGDQLVAKLIGYPALPNTPNISEFMFVNWVYNNGTAIGGETKLKPPYTFQKVPAVFINGLRKLENHDYVVGYSDYSINLTLPLKPNDVVIVQLGGEADAFSIDTHTAREALRRTYAEAGLILIEGSFEEGATVTTKQDVVLERKTGKGYNWQGDIPSGGKVIPAGATPSSAGGVGTNKWQDLSGTTYANQREFTNGKQYTLYHAFEAAVTLTSVTEAVQFSAGGAFYRWDGAFPQGGLAIPKNTPEPSPDQTGPGKYIVILDLEVKSSLSKQAKEALRRTYLEAGYSLVSGSFERGGTVTKSTDVLLYESSGLAYSWTGPFPKTVVSGSSPQQGWNSEDAATLRSALAKSSGASLVGYKAVSVEHELNIRAAKSIGFGENPIATMPSRNAISSNWANGKRGVVVLGDSISHGAFAGNLFTNGWTRLLARAVNGQLGTSSYGFAPMLTLGSGQPYQSIDIHSLSFTNAGSGWAARDAENGAGYLNGFAFRSVNAGNKVRVIVPSFQRRLLVHHANQVGGGEFTVKVNGAVKATVSTSIDTNTFAVTEFALDDDGYGSVTVELETTNAGPVDLCGFSYLSGVLESCTHNFSQSGRRVVNLSRTVIDEVFSKSSVVVFALGHNDSGESDASYIASVTSNIDYVISAAKKFGTSVVVPDFCWTAPASNWMRVQLLRLASETNGVYVDFPSLLAYPTDVPADSARLVTDLKLFVDASHPNDAGNALIFEQVAAAMGLACTSKSEALNSNDYWVSIPFKQSSGLKNKLASLPSSVKRVPGGFIYKLYLTSESGGVIPQGVFSVSDGFPVKAAVSATQGIVAPLMKLDASVLIGGISVAASGATSITVGSGGAAYRDIYTTLLMA